MREEKMRKIGIFLLLAGMLTTGCTRKEDVVAYVGRKKITVSEFKGRVDDLPDYYLGFIATEGGKRQYLSGIIKEEILLLKSRDYNVDRQPAVIKRLNDMKREVLLAAVMDYLQKEKVKVSDQEIRDFFEENREDFSNPEQIKVSHILLSNERTAQEVMRKIKQRKSFEQLSREYSIDTVTAINGGDLGYFGKDEMLQPEFEKEVFKLKNVGDISDIIKTPFGYHIAKLTGRRRGKEKSFEESKEQIRLKIEKQRFNSFIEEYRREYNVRVNYDVLDDIKIIEKEEPEIEKAP